MNRQKQFPIVLLVALCASAAPAQNIVVRWSAFDMGFTVAASANTSMKALIGQTFAGVATQASAKVTSGLLANPVLTPVTDIRAGAPGIPFVYALRQNFPNPFNPGTTIEFDVPKSSFVSLKVYNLLGQEISTLLSREIAPGSYSVEFNGEGFPSGVYFYRIAAGDFVAARKFVLMK
jgi:hypothetical protein